jgi:hypothetical protein
LISYYLPALMPFLLHLNRLRRKFLRA